MALNAYGFAQVYPPEIGAKFHECASESWRGEKVHEGFNVSAGAGASLSVSKGRAVLPGLYVEDTSAAAIPISSGHRGKTNTAVIDADWTANNGNGFAKLDLIEGGSSAPTLTRIAGTRWQTPLADVVVSSGGAITSITPRAPMPRKAYPLFGAMSVSTFGPNASPRDVGTLSHVDPGWPYVVELTAHLRVLASGGQAEGWFRVKGGNSQRVTSPWLNQRTESFLHSWTSGTLTGPLTASLQLVPKSVPQSSTLQVFSGEAYFRGFIHPA